MGLLSPSLNSPPGLDGSGSPTMPSTHPFPLFHQDPHQQHQHPVPVSVTPLPGPRHSRVPSLVVSPAKTAVGTGPLGPDQDDAATFSPGRLHGTSSAANIFLSPLFPADLTFSFDDPANAGSTSGVLSPPTRSDFRNDDGSWVGSFDAHLHGLPPFDPAQPSPQADLLAPGRNGWEARRSQVEAWLTTSGPTNGRSDDPTLALLNRSRKRAKSTNDVPAQGFPVTDFLSVNPRPARGSVSRTGAPGPGVYLDVPSHDGFEEDDDDMFSLARSESHAPSAIFPGGDGTLLDSVHSDFPQLSPHPEMMDMFPEKDLLSVPGANLWADYVLDPTPSIGQIAPGPTLHHHSHSHNHNSHQLSPAETQWASLLAQPAAVPAPTPPVPADPTDVFSSFSWNNANIGERQRAGSTPNLLGLVQPSDTVGPSRALKRKSSFSSHDVVGALEPSSGPVFAQTIPQRGDNDPVISTAGREQRPSVTVNNSSSDMLSLNWSSKAAAANAAASATTTNTAVVAGRTRSKSDLGQPTTRSFQFNKIAAVEQTTSFFADFGASLRRSAAPPVLSPPSFPTPSPVDDEADMKDIRGVPMDFSLSTDSIKTTFDGFRAQISQLNPRLCDELVSRFAREQMKRYVRLAQLKVAHQALVQAGRCPSGKLCHDMGGKAEELAPDRDGNGPTIFQVPVPGQTESEANLAVASANAGDDTVVQMAQFSFGIPSPHASRLPARFECHICFKVQEINKPSDWSKHVLEDIQPFICTFPGCREPKTFKRKADWVRHENERHRQLEKWICDLPGCSHVCSRKENFFQHLVREHKMDPKHPATGSTEAAKKRIKTIVDRCRTENTGKVPAGEPCRFCGNICHSWQKHMIHLGQHMQQVAMPLIQALADSGLTADSVVDLPGRSEADCADLPAIFEPVPSAETGNTLTVPSQSINMGLPSPQPSDLSSAEQSDTAMSFFDPDLTNGNLQMADPTGANALLTDSILAAAAASDMQSGVVSGSGSGFHPPILSLHPGSGKMTSSSSSTSLVGLGSPFSEVGPVDGSNMNVLSGNTTFSGLEVTPASSAGLRRQSAADILTTSVGGRPRAHTAVSASHLHLNPGLFNSHFQHINPHSRPTQTSGLSISVNVPTVSPLALLRTPERSLEMDSNSLLSIHPSGSTTATTMRGGFDSHSLFAEATAGLTDQVEKPTMVGIPDGLNENAPTIAFPDFLNLGDVNMTQSSFGNVHDSLGSSDPNVMMSFLNRQ